AAYCEHTSPFAHTGISAGDRDDAHALREGEFLIWMRVTGNNVYTGIMPVEGPGPEKPGPDGYPPLTRASGAGYDLLIDPATGRQWTVRNDTDPTGRRRASLMGSFRGYIKTRLSKFKGLHASTMY